jgi:exodeoxyribonuclease VII large subunit
MDRRSEPPDWALPSWDAVEAERPIAVSGPGPGAGPTGTFGLRIRTVSEVTRGIRDLLRADEGLRDLWVEGEVSRVTVSSAGHAYFGLKDERSQLSCVWFRDDRMASPFQPQAGLRIVVHGRLDVFESQGVYQLYVASIQPAGFGDLALRFEATKARLAAEGLFDAGRKRTLPTRPAAIAVVTSPTGAVWHDIRTVLARRWPLVRVAISPCQVQGEGAEASIVAALRRVARWADQCRAAATPDDAPLLTILARGGGSLEDLAPFNDERVVRAVVSHPLPVVAGVGHETDVTLVDFAADVRAPTPSAAAELVVPDRSEALRDLRRELGRGTETTAARLAAERSTIATEGRALAGLRPDARLVATRERIGFLLDGAARRIVTRLDAARRDLDRAGERMAPLLRSRLEGQRAVASATGDRLRALGPGATLERGYAIVARADDGAIVRDPGDAPAGTRLRLRVARGELPAVSGDGQ